MSTESQDNTKRNTQANACLILGAISIVFALFNFAPGFFSVIGFVGAVAALLAFLAGERGLRAARGIDEQGRKLAIAGIAGGGLGLPLFIITFIVAKTLSPTQITDDYGVPMLLVSAGSFEMGSDADDAFAECEELLFVGDCARSYFEDEEPVHSVALDHYYIDKYEVTNAQYADFLNDRGNQGEGGVNWLDAIDEDVRIVQSGSQWEAKSGFADHPVIEVTWFGANAYCDWRGVSLPTEAEWEKAARGTEGQMYPWGEAFDGERANFCDTNCGYDWANNEYDDGYAESSPAGAYGGGVSPYDVYDMAGNVAEWTSSLYESYPYDSEDGRENEGAYGSRVVRGASWSSSGNYLSASYRHWADPDVTDYFIGFRCASSDP